MKTFLFAIMYIALLLLVLPPLMILGIKLFGRYLEVYIDWINDKFDL